MRKSEFTESQIVATLEQVEGGRQVKDVCRDLGIPTRRITSGSPSTAARRPLMCSAFTT
ncbi:transposase [Xanthomonas arboricola]|uniref:transposase n=1 Tax=Xanthomonas arboricola TaxID=56448 RepID=UPI003CE4FE29